MHRIMWMGWIAALALAASAAAAPRTDVVTLGPEPDGASAAAVVVTDAGGPDGAPAQVTMTIQALGTPDEPAPDLGLATSPVPAALGKHLDLPDGMGLAVDAVADGSPAARAGVERHDVLVRLADQLLINPPQLAALMRHRKRGETLTLTLLRQRREQTVTVLLDGPEAPPAVNAAGGAVGLGGGWAAVAQNQAAIRLGPMIVMQAGQDANVASVSSASLSDGEHTLHLTTRGQRKNLVAQDREGNVIFAGPIQTPEQRKAVPPDVLRKVEQLEQQPRRLNVNFPPRFPPGEEPPVVKAEPGPRALGTKVEVTMTEAGLTLALTADDAGQRLVAKDKEGQVVFEGPVGTEEERAKMPDRVRDLLERLTASCGAIFFGK